MKRRFDRSVLLAFGLASVVAVLAVAQSSFPVRFDDPEAGSPGLVTSPPSGVVADYLTLRPRSTPPFTCTASEVGSLYIQLDTTLGFAYQQLLCHCQAKDDFTGYFWKAAGSTTLDCALLLTP